MGLWMRPILALLSLIGLYALRHYLNRNASSSSLPLPPGPKSRPIIGNVHDLPLPDSPDWIHWLKHKELYGPISTVSAFGQRLIILNDVNLAIDLLHKRAGIHSDRPDAPFAVLAGWENGSAVLRTSRRVLAGRKLMHREIGTKASISRFQETMDREVQRFLQRMLDAPGDLFKHARKLAGAVILKITYGYEIDHDQEGDRGDPLVDIADTALVNFSASVRPGAWIVDLVPVLKYIPSWFPGAGFQRTAAIFRKQTEALADVPWAFVKKQMQDDPGNDTYRPSYVSNLLRDNPDLVPGSSEETIIRWTAASLYGGGADTTVSTITSFYLAMTLFPEVQRRAQEEIDTVIGRSRLPTIHDREKLPYIDALVKEALRWHPVLPMGLPHRSMKEDVCNGYRIPKDSIILPNIWAFTHDPSNYHNPSTFNPSRFLGPSPEQDPHLLVFGFGRRICPGRVLADRTIFLTIAQSVAAFRIHGADIANIDKQSLGIGIDVGLGDESGDGGIEVNGFRPRFTPGVISHPERFGVGVEVRDEVYEGLMSVVASGEKQWGKERREKSDADVLRGIVESGEWVRG